MADILRVQAALGAPEAHSAASLSELYHENTKVRPVPGAQTMLASSYSIPELRAMSRSYKQYRLHPHVPLPDPKTLPPATMTFDEVIARRRTVRQFADDAMGLPDLSRLLHLTYGITGEERMPGGGIQHMRAAPSAGGLYPGEIYLGIRNVQDLEPGLYHYEVPDHSLALLEAGDPSERLYRACCAQQYARQAAATVLLAGALHRTKRKYGERGYRYVFLDLGHLAQNMCLAATALGLAMTTTCGFFDDLVAEMLGLDGIDEAVLYVAFVGKPGAVGTVHRLITHAWEAR